MKHSSATRNVPPERPKIKNPEFFRLVEAEGIIDRDFINDLLEEFDNNALDVLATMIQSGFASKRKLCQIWCDSIGIAHVDLEKTLFQPDVVKKVPERIARMYYAIPVYQMGHTITVATATPDNKRIQEVLKDVVGGPVSLVFALPQDIELSIEKEYKTRTSIHEFFNKISSSKLLTSQKKITRRMVADAGGDSVLNQMHVAIILYAVTKSASKINISGGPDEAGIEITVPYKAPVHFSIEKPIYDHLITRLKTLAGLEPAAEGVQHGRILVPTPGKKIDLRFEYRPGDNGPAAILHISAPKPFREILSLKNLGLSYNILTAIAGQLKQPRGHVLLAGPPKSGKTTLAYAMLDERTKSFKKNITIEQAIKFLLPGIDQLQVNPKAGVSAMSLIEAAVQQKSDTIYIQNIEDAKLAEKASAVSEAGHFILSGIKANNAFDALEKIMSLGGGRSLTAILAQQRVARLCDICKVKYTLKQDHVRTMFETDGDTTVYAWRGNGCAYCNDTGFSGLIGLQELLIIDDKTRNMIINHSSIDEIRKAVQTENHYTMHYDGIKKVLRGLTTFDEIHRLSFS